MNKFAEEEWKRDSGGLTVVWHFYYVSHAALTSVIANQEPI